MTIDICKIHPCRSMQYHLPIIPQNTTDHPASPLKCVSPSCFLQWLTQKGLVLQLIMDKGSLGQIPMAASLLLRIIRTQASPSHAHQLCTHSLAIAKQTDAQSGTASCCQSAGCGYIRHRIISRTFYKARRSQENSLTVPHANKSSREKPK